MGFDGGNGDEHRVLYQFRYMFGYIDDVADLERQEGQVGIVPVERPIFRAKGRWKLNIAFDEEGARGADAGPRGELEDTERCVTCRGCGWILAVVVDGVDEQRLHRHDDDVRLGYQAAAPRPFVAEFLQNIVEESRDQWRDTITSNVKEWTYPDGYTGLPVDNPHFTLSPIEVRHVPSNQITKDLNVIPIL